jgi:hypothetical protein
LSTVFRIKSLVFGKLYVKEFKEIIMKKNEYNLKAITDVYKNAHIALQSISDLLPSVDEDDIKSVCEQYID